MSRRQTLFTQKRKATTAYDTKGPWAAFSSMNAENAREHRFLVVPLTSLSSFSKLKDKSPQLIFRLAAAQLQYNQKDKPSLGMTLTAVTFSSEHQITVSRVGPGRAYRLCYDKTSLQVQCQELTHPFESSENKRLEEADFKSIEKGLVSVPNPIAPESLPPLTMNTTRCIGRTEFQAAGVISAPDCFQRDWKINNEVAEWIILTSSNCKFTPEAIQRKVESFFKTADADHSNRKDLLTMSSVTPKTVKTAQPAKAPVLKDLPQQLAKALIKDTRLRTDYRPSEDITIVVIPQGTMAAIFEAKSIGLDPESMLTDSKHSFANILETNAKRWSKLSAEEQKEETDWLDQMEGLEARGNIKLANCFREVLVEKILNQNNPKRQNYDDLKFQLLFNFISLEQSRVTANSHMETVRECLYFLSQNKSPQFLFLMAQLVDDIQRYIPFTEQGKEIFISKRHVFLRKVFGISFNGISFKMHEFMLRQKNSGIQVPHPERLFPLVKALWQILEVSFPQGTLENVLKLLPEMSRIGEKEAIEKQQTEWDQKQLEREKQKEQEQKQAQLKKVRDEEDQQTLAYIEKLLMIGVHNEGTPKEKFQMVAVNLGNLMSWVKPVDKNPKRSESAPVKEKKEDLSEADKLSEKTEKEKVRALVRDISTLISLYFDHLGNLKSVMGSKAVENFMFAFEELCRKAPPTEFKSVQGKKLMMQIYTLENDLRYCVGLEPKSEWIEKELARLEAFDSKGEQKSDDKALVPKFTLKNLAVGLSAVWRDVDRDNINNDLRQHSKSLVIKMLGLTSLHINDQGQCAVISLDQFRSRALGIIKASPLHSNPEATFTSPLKLLLTGVQNLETIAQPIPDGPMISAVANGRA